MSGEYDWKTEIEVVSLDDLTIHELAKITPPSMSYEVMRNDIAASEQKDPVYVYRNQICDGRHRFKALKELGISTIMIARMPNNWSLSRVRSEVISIEMSRRHQTPTQKAIFSYREMIATKARGESMTIVEAAAMFGSNTKMIQRVGKIAEVKKGDTKIIKFGRPDIVEELFNGGTYNVGDAYNQRPTDSLDSIIRFLEKNMSVGQADMLNLEEAKEEPSAEDVVFINQVINKLGERSMVCKTELNSRIYNEFILGDK